MSPVCTPSESWDPQSQRAARVDPSFRWDDNVQMSGNDRIRARRNRDSRADRPYLPGVIPKEPPMNTALLLIDVQESFRQRPYFQADDCMSFLDRTNALIA